MRRSSSVVALAPVALSVALLSSSGAHAQWRNASSLYTEDGVEIGVDGRVFTLFAMLNAVGFDDDTLRGPPPVKKALFTAARQKTRGNLGRPGPAIKALEAVLAKNAVDKSAYVAAALELGPAPNFEDKSASALGKAIAGPMRDWFNEEGGAAVLRIVADEAKPTQKKLLPIVDKAVKSTTGLIRLGDAQEQLLDDTGAQGRVVLVLNELDVHGGVQRVQHGDVTYVVAGAPASDADEAAIVNAVVTSYAKTLVVRDAAKGAVPGSLADASKLSADAKSGVVDDKGYATELLACAFMQKVRGRDAACSASPLGNDAAATAALAVLAPRVDAFATDSAVLGASVVKLLEAAPPPPETVPAAVEEKKPEDKKGKKTKAAKGG
jgi:hypothetical protein